MAHFILGKFVFRGDLDVFARTASKYDDCRLLHVPGLKFRLEFKYYSQFYCTEITV